MIAYYFPTQNYAPSSCIVHTYLSEITRTLSAIIVSWLYVHGCYHGVVTMVVTMVQLPRCHYPLRQE